ncbi:MAG: glycoside hydrolase family protein [Smithella sp.]|jgi:lysozyme
MTLKELLVKHEGWKLKPYKCSAGKWTVGCGYNFSDNPLPEDIEKYLSITECITDEMADRLLDLSIGWAVADCHKLFPRFNKFSQKRQDALIDFLFNVGIRTAKKFVHTIAAINTGRWEDAADGFRNSAWFRQVNERGIEIASMIEDG